MAIAPCTCDTLERRLLLTNQIVFLIPDPQPLTSAYDVTQGFAVHVHLDDTEQPATTAPVLENHYEWDFDDSQYVDDPRTSGLDKSLNIGRLEGFSAAHIYDTPGTYTLRLLVNGSVVDTETVIVTAFTPTHIIYVDSASGHDKNPDNSTNNGASADNPIQSVGAANALLHTLSAGSVHLRFKRGTTYTLWQDDGINQSGVRRAGQPELAEIEQLKIERNNVQVDDYGNRELPLPKLSYVQFYQWKSDTQEWVNGYTVPMFELGGGTTNVTVRNIHFATSQGSALGDAVSPHSGKNLVVRDCFFDRLSHAVHASNSGGQGLLLQGNRTEGYISSYFLWNQMDDVVVLANNHESTYEGGNNGTIRMESLVTQRMLVTFNHFTRIIGTIIRFHGGEYLFVTQNVLSAPNENSLAASNFVARYNQDPDATLRNVVWERNELSGRLAIGLNADGIMVRNNILKEGSERQYLIGVEEQRNEHRLPDDFGARNIYILNNTGIQESSSSAGGFLDFDEGDFDDQHKSYNWNVVGNVYIADSGYEIGSDLRRAAIVFSRDTGTSSFSEIRDNIWPAPTVSSSLGVTEARMVIAGGYYGDNYYLRNSGGGTVTYGLPIQSAHSYGQGNYRLYLNCPDVPNLPSQVTVTVNGTSTVVSLGSGSVDRWVRVGTGTFTFTPGQTYSVQVTNTSGALWGDVVRAVRVPGSGEDLEQASESETMTRDGGSWTTVNGYVSRATWQSQSFVSNDTFANVSIEMGNLPTKYAVTSSGYTNTANPVSGVFNDYYGNPRSQSAADWTAGAVELNNAAGSNLASLLTGSGNDNDRWLLRRSASMLQVWHRSDGQAIDPGVDTVHTFSIQAVTVLGNGGNDEVIVDFTGGDPLGGNAFAFDGGSGTTDRLVAVLRPGGSIVGGNNGAIYYDSTLSYSNIEAATVRVESGSQYLGSLFNPSGVPLTIEAVGSGTFVSLGNTTEAAVLNISGGATAQVPLGAGIFGATEFRITQSLTIDSASKLDLTNNALRVDGASVATIRALIQSAYNNGNWDLHGITSSVAAVKPSQEQADIANRYQSTALGYADAGGYVVVKYTWYGDADLNRLTNNSADVAAWTAGAGNLPASWASGDFNYTGTVTSDDLALLNAAAAVGALVAADVNKNGVVDLADAAAFYAAISAGRKSVFASAHSTWEYLNADCNFDGYVDALDIDAFQAVLRAAHVPFMVAGPSPATSLTGTNFVSSGSLLFFLRNDGVHGTELWRTDGSASGTFMVKDINPGNSDSGIYWMIDVAGTLFFNADDGENGDELWKSDGTLGGTVLVSDINPGSDGSLPRDLVSFGGCLYFFCYDGSDDSGLWKSDGTAAGTLLIVSADTDLLAPIYQIMGDVGGTLYFVTDDGTDSHLWASDGTNSGTVEITTSMTGQYWVNKSGAVGSEAFFVITSGGGYTLWQSDGPTATALKFFSYNVTDLTACGGALYFLHHNGSGHAELWTSDGTALGTVMVKDFGSSSTASQLVEMDGTLYLVVSTSTYGSELWTSDGTTSGTTLLKDIRSGSTGSSLTSLRKVNGMLYFAANDGTNGTELWKSDGTSTGTTLLANLNSGSGASSTPSGLINVGDVLYFLANDGTHGSQLWELLTAN